jgi:hypothetical protein
MVNYPHRLLAQSVHVEDQYTYCTLVTSFGVQFSVFFFNVVE